MRISAFTRYGPRAASTRQRLLQYLPKLSAAGLDVEWHALLDDDYVQSLTTGETYPKARVVKAYANRFQQLARSSGPDLLWVYAELFPYLPAWVERFATGAAIPIVYDLDDAFFHRYDQHPSQLIRGILGGKFKKMLASAAACCCGNSYINNYVAQFCPNSIILPTVVDTMTYRPSRRPASGSLVIGWIGSPSTWPNVRPLLPMLADLCASRNIRFRVIGAGRLTEGEAFPGLEFVDWNEAAEIHEIQQMDIGIMPLIDGPFERGKSGYKLIQYMACGLPVVASPVGANREIVADGVNGYLATSIQQWRGAIGNLIDNDALRVAFGENGRKRVETGYSLDIGGPRLIKLLKSAKRISDQ